jgi:hypothetical protein
MTASGSSGSTSYSSYLAPAHTDAGASAYSSGRNEPAPPVADVDEEKVASDSVEAFDQPAPAAVAAAGRDGHVPAIALADVRRLDLDAREAIAEVRDEVHVGAVAKGHEDLGAVASQPAHRRQLADVGLQARR